jgi:hypothetical protein
MLAVLPACSLALMGSELIAADRKLVIDVDLKLKLVAPVVALPAAAS